MEQWEVRPATVLAKHGVPDNLESATTCRRGHVLPEPEVTRTCRECPRLRRRVREEVLKQRYETRERRDAEPTLEDLVVEQQREDTNKVYAQHMVRPDGWDSGWDKLNVGGG